MGFYTTSKTTKKRDKCISKKQAENSALQKKIEQQQAEIERLKAKATALGQTLQTCLQLPVRGQPCVINTSNPDATEYKSVYWMDAVMDCLEANTAMRYDREMAYLSVLPPSQYYKAVKKLEKERAAKAAQS